MYSITTFTIHVYILCCHKLYFKVKMCQKIEFYTAECTFLICCISSIIVIHWQPTNTGILKYHKVMSCLECYYIKLFRTDGACKGNFIFHFFHDFV